MTTEELMLVCAVRYALGRQSYIVGTTCEFVAGIKDKLSQNCINIMIKDIEESIKYHHSVGRNCGMDIDERNWLNLLDILKGCKNG